ncbi:hypothetical protein [Nodularia chucula]|uniref:hypothetical protein n=1 Tax=Nodularia chucula TaxID=3093667 RepID=UPI0039C5ADE6
MSKIGESSLALIMTSSVTDKKPIPANERRRHSDTPGLWVAIAIGSFSLHLLVFWFMRSTQVFTPWFPQQNETFVPIEFIELSPPEELAEESNSEPETVPKSAIPPQESAPDPAPESFIPPTTPSNQNTQAINSPASIVSESRTATNQVNTPVLPEKQVSPPTPTPTPPPPPTSTPTPPMGDLPWNRREEVVLGQGQALPSDIPSIPPELPTVPESEQGQTANFEDEENIPTGSTANTPDNPIAPAPTGSTANTLDNPTAPAPTGSTANTPDNPIAPAPTEETANTPAQSGVIVTFTPINQPEIDQLIQQGRLRRDGLPDVIATHKGSNTKTLELSYLTGNSVVEPAQVLASLIIDNNGNFEQAQVLEIEPARLQSQRDLYNQIINDVFINDRFLPGHNHDGTKPEVSSLFIRISIQPVSSN